MVTLLSSGRIGASPPWISLEAICLHWFFVDVTPLNTGAVSCWLMLGRTISLLAFAQPLWVDPINFQLSTLRSTALQTLRQASV